VHPSLTSVHVSSPLDLVRASWLSNTTLGNTTAILVFRGHFLFACEPVNNRRLAELMGCSPSRASKCVAQLEGIIRKQRQGGEVFLSLPALTETEPPQ
jgi:hypothetical protein